MAMNATRLTLNVKGVNKTGKVFKEIALSAGHVAKDVALIGGAAIAGAAAAFALAAKSLSHLTDVAMQAGTSAEDITKLSTALNVLGIKSQAPEQIAVAFQKMAKSIGETGIGGFKKAIQSIAELATVEERSAAAMAVFGKSGLDFMPLVEAAARNGIDSLNAVIDGMPAISDAAANAGDSVADAMVLMTGGAKALWMNAVGEICNLLDAQFTGGVREAALKGNAYMEYFAKAAVRQMVAAANGIVSVWQGLGGTWENVVIRMGTYLTDYFKAIGKWISDFVNVTWDDIAKYGLFGKANANFSKSIEKATDKLWEGVNFEPFFSAQMDDLDTTLRTKLADAAKASAAVSSAAVGFAATDAAADTADKIDTAVKKARNELLLGGSYKAATMSINSEYGKGEKDKVVKSVDRVKSFVEKISNVNSKIAAALGDLEPL